MARMHTYLALSLLSFAAVGCVSTERYTAAKMDADQYATRLSAVEREKAEAVAERDLLKQQLANIQGTGDDKQAIMINQATQISDLQHQLADANRRYADAAGKVGHDVVLLPTDLNEALKAFAASNPDLIEFDQNRGIVKFKSDVTFSPGRAVLTSSAISAIDRFAGILNSPAAVGYELMVVGHTDSDRVHSAQTIAEGHKDNWYLSAHRAISVSNELQKHAVSPGRLEVAGFADQRPIAPNTSEAGKAQNRRVEVLIMPSSNHASSTVATTATEVARPAAAHETAGGLNKDLNKDKDSPAPPRSVFNK